MTFTFPCFFRLHGYFVFLLLGIDDYVVERMYNSLNDGFQVQKLQCFYIHGRLLFDHAVDFGLCESVASNKQSLRTLQDYEGYESFLESQVHIFRTILL